MLNHIVLMGRVTRDPELRRTGSGIASRLSRWQSTGISVPVRPAKRRRISSTSLPGATRRNLSASILPKAAWLWFLAACKSETGQIRKAISAAVQRSSRIISISAIPSAIRRPIPLARLIAQGPMARLRLLRQRLQRPSAHRVPRLLRHRHRILPCWRMTTTSSRSDLQI